jgi:hypothetical protein
MTRKTPLHTETPNEFFWGHVTIVHEPPSITIPTRLENEHYVIRPANPYVNNTCTFVRSNEVYIVLQSMVVFYKEDKTQKTGIFLYIPETSSLSIYEAYILAQVAAMSENAEIFYRWTPEDDSF